MLSSKWLRNNLGLIILAIIGLVFLYAMMTPLKTETKQIGISELLKNVKTGKVKTMLIDEKKIDVTEINDEQYEVFRDPQTDILQLLNSQDVNLADIDIQFKDQQKGGVWVDVLTAIVPTILIIGFIIFLMRQASGGAGGGAFSFGKSRARMFNAEGIEDKDEEEKKGEERKRTTFDDVAALEEAKEELKEIVEFLREPKKFIKLGARIPKGVLLIGSPGTGKTLLARAVAGEAKVPFFSISGSEFVEMFVGVGASRVRDLFEQAKNHSPCIVFVDEIDAVGRQRGSGVGGGHDEREQTLNQILVEMDGFNQKTNIIIIAATNRPDVLDPALLRPGRFDRQVVLDSPDIKGRLAILRIHARNKPIAKSVDMEVVAKQTAGFSGADLENLVNEAALLTARKNKTEITLAELEESVDRVLAGPQKRSRIVTEEQKKLTAYHEAGHALVAHMLEHADPVHKISIVARGMAGGFTRFLPKDERYNWTRSQFLDTISAMLAGYAAEAIIFGEVTTGASDDLKRASAIARSMVTRYGMSAKLGPQAFGENQQEIFLGRDFMHQRNYSEEVANLIDSEVSVIMNTCYKIAEKLTSKHRKKLDMIAEMLMEKETVGAEEFATIFTETLPKKPSKKTTKVLPAQEKSKTKN